MSSSYTLKPSSKRELQSKTMLDKSAFLSYLHQCWSKGSESIEKELYLNQSLDIVKEGGEEIFLGNRLSLRIGLKVVR